nr:MAG: envelope protein [Bat faecal associated retrovirus 1]
MEPYPVGYRRVSSGPMTPTPPAWSPRTRDNDLDDLVDGLRRLGLRHRTRRRRRPTRATQNSVNVTWGQVKRLTSDALTLVDVRHLPRTPDNVFLAILALLTVQVSPVSLASHWAYVPDPPFLRPVTWEDPPVFVFLNDTRVLGPPENSFITPQVATDYNFRGRAVDLPLCFSNKKHDWSYCLPVERDNLYTEGQAPTGMTREYQQWIDRQYILTIMGPSDFGHPAEGHPHPPKFPPCRALAAKNQQFLEFPPWLQCIHPHPVLHTMARTNHYVYDWGVANPLGTTEIQRMTSPGGWVARILSTETGGTQPYLWRLMAATAPIRYKHGNSTLDFSITACVPPPYLLVVGLVHVNPVSQREDEGDGYEIVCSKCNLTNCLSPADGIWDVILVHQPAFVMIPVNISGPWYQHTGVQILGEIKEMLARPRRFVGLLVAGIAALVAIVATATTAAVALTQEIHTAQYVNQLAKNISIALGAQERIDRKIEQRLDVLEQTVLLIGDQLTALKVRANLPCHAEYDSICVTPKLYNSSSLSWDKVRTHLLGIWQHTNFSLDIGVLHDEIMAIANAQPPLQKPAELAQEIFSSLESWFSHFHGLSIVYSVVTAVVAILIILCLLPVGIRLLCSSLRAMRVSIHELRLKSKEGGDVGGRVPKGMA